MSLSKSEIDKVREHIKDFDKKTTFNIADLQYYDNNILEKVNDINLYEEVLNMNLFKIESERFYGGIDIRVYKSKRNGHYIYSTYSWGY